jgi:hypothetical protein
VVTPGAVASGGQFARFVLKGCGLGVTQSVTVGGVPASFQADSDLRLEVSLPAGVALGAQPVVVSGPNGSDSSVINVGLAGPALTCWANFVSDLAWQLDGSSGQAYGVLFSGVVGPTALPGIVDLDIGNGVAGLFVHQLGLLNTFGEAEGKLVGGATLPNGTQIYLQAVVFDLATLTLVPSNVSQALKAVHFG